MSSASVGGAAGEGLIVETSPRGHRLYHVALLARHLLDRGWRPVLLTSRETPTAAAFDVHLRDVDGLEVVTADLPARLDRLTRVWRWAAETRRLIHERGSAVAAVLPGDALLPGMVTRRLGPSPARVSALVMRPPSGAGATAIRKRTVLRSAGRAGVVPYVLVPPTPDGPAPGEVEDPVTVAHDASERPALRDRLGLPRDRSLVLVAGRLDRRKFLDELLPSWDRAAPPGVTLLLAGSPDDAVRTLLADPRMVRMRQRERVILREGYASDDEFDAYVAASDTVLLTYRNDGSSGLLGKAMLAGVPVVAAGNPTVTAAVRSWGCGVVTGLAPDAVGDGIADVLERREDHTAALRRAADHLAGTPTRFAETLLGLSDPSSA